MCVFVFVVLFHINDDDDIGGGGGCYRPFSEKKKIQINYFDLCLGFAIYPLFLLHTHTRLHIIVIYLVVNNVCV